MAQVWRIKPANGKACCRPEAHGPFVTAFPRVHTDVNNQLKMCSDLKRFTGKNKEYKVVFAKRIPFNEMPM